jgi:hypothetical protein
MKSKVLHYSIIGIFTSLYLLVATISMINSVEFFNLTHSSTLSWSLAIGFELGAAASLAAIIILKKTNKNLVWGLFLLLTLFQMMANSYHAYANLADYRQWIELFGLERQDVMTQKRILSVISGAVLPLVALGFIKSLVDYIRPEEDNEIEKLDNKSENIKEIKVQPNIVEKKEEDADTKVKEIGKREKSGDAVIPSKGPSAPPDYKP